MNTSNNYMLHVCLWIITFHILRVCLFGPWGENLVDGKIRKEKGMENMGFSLLGSQGKVGGKLEVRVFSHWGLPKSYLAEGIGSFSFQNPSVCLFYGLD